MIIFLLVATIGCSSHQNEKKEFKKFKPFKRLKWTKLQEYDYKNVSPINLHTFKKGNKGSSYKENASVVKENDFCRHHKEESNNAKKSGNEKHKSHFCRKLKRHHKKDLLSGLAEALKDANVSVENHAHSQALKSSILKTLKPRRTFLDALKGANISIKNSVHSQSMKSKICKYNSIPKRSLADALNNANISIENSVHNCMLKRRYLHKKHGLADLPNALKKETNSVKNSVHSYSTKSKVLKKAKRHDVAAQKRDQEPGGSGSKGVELRGNSALEVAAEIENNDKTFIPMLSSSSPHGIQKDTEDALEGRSTEHHEEGEEKSPEYRQSDKDEFSDSFNNNNNEDHENSRGGYPEDDHRDHDYQRYDDEERHENNDVRHYENDDENSQNHHDEENHLENGHKPNENKDNYYDHDEGLPHREEKGQQYHASPEERAPSPVNDNPDMNAYIGNDYNSHHGQPNSLNTYSGPSNEFNGRNAPQNSFNRLQSSQAHRQSDEMHSDMPDEMHNDHHEEDFHNPQYHGDESKHENGNFHGDSSKPSREFNEREHKPSFDEYRDKQSAMKETDYGNEGHHNNEESQTFGKNEHEDTTENGDKTSHGHERDYESNHDEAEHQDEHNGHENDDSEPIKQHGFSELKRPRQGFSNMKGALRLQHGGYQNFGMNCNDKKNCLPNSGRILLDNGDDRHLTRIEKMMEYQRNPFDGHDVSTQHAMQPAVHSPVPESVLQIGVDPAVGLHYYGNHRQSLTDNNLLKHSPAGQSMLQMDEFNHNLDDHHRNPSQLGIEKDLNNIESHRPRAMHDMTLDNQHGMFNIDLKIPKVNDDNKIGNPLLGHTEELNHPPQDQTVAGTNLHDEYLRGVYPPPNNHPPLLRMFNPPHRELAMFHSRQRSNPPHNEADTQEGTRRSGSPSTTMPSESPMTMASQGSPMPLTSPESPRTINAPESLNPLNPQGNPGTLTPSGSTATLNQSGGTGNGQVLEFGNRDYANYLHQHLSEYLKQADYDYRVMGLQTPNLDLGSEFVRRNKGKDAQIALNETEILRKLQDNVTNLIESDYSSNSTTGKENYNATKNKTFEAKTTPKLISNDTVTNETKLPYDSDETGTASVRKHIIVRPVINNIQTKTINYKRTKKNKKQLDSKYCD